MKKCSECGVNDIEDKYIFCIDCAKKEKEAKEKEQVNSFKGIPDLINAIEKCTLQLINQLEKNNNNEYKQIRQNDVILRENHKIKIVWDKTKKDFIERKLK